MPTRVLVAVASAVACSACLSSTTVIRVKADGSGTVEQTLLVNVGNMEKAFAGMGFKPTGGSRSSGAPPTIKTED